MQEQRGPENTQHTSVPPVPPTEYRTPHALDALSGSFRSFADSLLQDGKDVANEKKRQVSDYVGGKVVEALDKIGAHPDEQKGAVSELVRILPLIGPTVLYADAWKISRQAKETGNEALKERARAECLLAIADAGIDVALFSTKAISVVAKLSRKLLHPLVGSRLARVFGVEQVDPVKTLVAQVAKTEPAKGIADYLLEKIAPKQDIRAQASTIKRDLETIVEQHEIKPEVRPGEGKD